MHITPTGAPGAPVNPRAGLRRLGRAAAAAGLAAAIIGVWATAAFAHVSVNPKEAPQGGFTKLSIRVPNERDNASTTKVAVQLPPDHPIPSVSVRPVPGWTVEVKKKTLDTPVKTDDGELKEVVDTITWTGGQIQPGEFQEFDVSVGPLPTDTNQLAFPAIQTYSNGDEVAWIEKPTADGKEPEHPAPVLTLTPKAADHDAASPATSAASPTGTAVAAKQEAAAAPTSTPASSSSSTAVAWVGVALGGLALVAAIIAIARGSRSAA